MTPTSPWAWALDGLPSMRFVDQGWRPGSAPFNKTASPHAAAAGFWPCYITATAREVSSQWGVLPDGKIAWQPRVPPASPACKEVKQTCGPPATVVLVPHGGTALRIGTMPLSGL